VKADIKQILALVFTPGIISALILSVAGNEKGLHYTTPSFSKDGIHLKLFKVGNFPTQQANEFQIMFLDRTELLKLQDIEIERQSLFGRDDKLVVVNVGDQTESKQKINAYMQNGFYRLHLVIEPSESKYDLEDLRYQISQENNGFKHLQPRRIDFFRNLLFLTYFYAMEIISISILTSSIVIILYYRKKKKNENTVNNYVDDGNIHEPATD